ncbi:MAG TPA: AsmA-like C-terminal region-containing protein [Oculatellaceae cyanobacterium]
MQRSVYSDTEKDTATSDNLEPESQSQPNQSQKSSSVSNDSLTAKPAAALAGERALSEPSPSPQTQTARPEIKTKTETAKIHWLIVKFLVGWLASMCLLFVIALSVNIDWAKPFLQRGLSLIINRDVQLGHLTWSWRPGNLTVETTKVAISGVDGSKLLVAGPSEVGLAFFPLLKKKVIVKHITLNHPQFWAVRVKDKGWNFDDLLTLGPDIQFIQANSGTVYVSDGLDATHPKWQTLKLEDINLKFLFPQRNTSTPLYVSFLLKKPKYTTKVIFTSFGGGPNEWQKNKYKFDTIVTHLNLDDIAPFVYTIGNIKRSAQLNKEDAVHGLFNAQMSGEGVFDQGLTANVKVSSERFSVDAEPFGIVSSPGETQGQISLDKQRLRWHDLIVNLANVQLHSSGEVDNWKGSNKHLDATVSGQINELQDLKKMIEVPQSDTAKKLVELNNFKLSGNAKIELKEDNEGNRTRIVTTFDTKGLQIKPFLDQNAKHLSPILTLVGLQKDALLTGKLEYRPGEHLKIEDGSLPIASGLVKAHGDFDLKQATSEVEFTAENIHLADLRHNLEEAANTKGFLSHFFYLPKNKHLEFGGILTASGKLNSKANSTVGEGHGLCSDGVLGVSDGSLNARKISGKLSWQDRKLKLENFHGTVGDGGTFTLCGLADLKGTPYIDWSIHANHLDLQQLNALMQLMRVQVPLFSENHLTGTVRSLVLEVTGSRDNPKISFTAVPENLFYAQSGLSKPLHATSGIISYKNDNLSLGDVSFVINGDVVHTTFTIEQLSHAAKLSALSLKTSGINLSDIHNYLSSTLMPHPLRQVYINFLKDNKIFDVHGRTAADITCKFTGDKIILSGHANLQEVQASVIEPGMRLQHIFGEVVAAGDDLVLHNVRGRYRDASVDIDGKMLRYTSDDPTYHIRVKASLTPDELVQLLPPAKEQLEQWGLALHSERALDLDCSYAGNKLKTNLKFELNVDPKSKLEVSSRFGDFYQPPGEPVSLTGEFVSNPNGIEIKDANVRVGNSHMLMAGKVGDESTKFVTPEKSLNWEGQPIHITMTSEKPVAIAHLLSALDPTIKLQDITGNMTGKIEVEGKLPNLSPRGEVVLSNINIPAWQVHDVSGVVKMLGISPHHSPEPIAELSVPSLNIGPLAAKNCKVSLALETPDEDPGTGFIRITGANADTMGGKAELSGTVDLKQRQMQMVVNLNKVSAAEVTEKLFKQHNQISGNVDMRIDVDTHGKNLHEVINNFEGDGDVEISNGSINKFGHLEAELKRVSVLHQGLVNLNWSGLWQSIMPSKSRGNYKTVSGQFKFDRQSFWLEQFKYSGEDMCLWASGIINLSSSTINMSVAGNIPRVSRGTVAGVSRAVRLTSFVNVATLGTLKSVPALPILGELNPDRSRTFIFRLNSPLDEPKAITQSAERTFRWLPSRQTASAHPVLDVN